MKYYYQGKRHGLPVDGTEEAADREQLVAALSKQSVTIDFVEVESDDIESFTESSEPVAQVLPERIAFREDRPLPFAWTSISWMLLTYGQVTSLITCLLCLGRILYVLTMPADHVPGRNPSFITWNVALSLLACFHSAAMFVVFTRVK